MTLGIKNNHNGKHTLLSISAMAGLVGLWAIVARIGLVPPFLLPSPFRVLGTMGQLVANGGLLGDVWSSLFRICIGFLLSLIVSVPLGLALGMSKKATAALEPLLAFIRYIPPSAFIPLGIIWFGIGEAQKVMIIFIGIAPYLTLLIADIVIGTRRELVDAALTLGARSHHLIAKVILPHAMPNIWDSFRIMIGWAWSFVIIAEIVGASSGLGHLMVESQRFLRTDSIFAAMLVIGLVGLATDYFFHIGYQKFFPWTEKAYAQAL